MKRIYKMAKKILLRHGTLIASCAFAFVLITANSSCMMPFYEIEEPEGLDAFKKFR